jgi:hypothetical protein
MNNYSVIKKVLSFYLVLKRRLNQTHEPEVFMRYIILTFTVIFLMAIMGCESNMLKPLADDSSKEASLEEAKMALDDGSYDSAISALSSYKGSSDPEIAGILSSAYMGKAGLDLTYMLEHIDSSNTDNFDVIASAFSLKTTDQLNASSSVLYKAGSDVTPRYITTDSVVTLLTNLSQAQHYLTTSLAANTGNKDITDDLTVQLGIASALHFIIDIGYIIAEVKDCNIPINQAAYQRVFPQKPDVSTLGNQVNTYLNTNATALQAFNGDITGLQTDLWNVYLTVEVFIKNIGLDESITSDFNKFITDLLGLPEGSSKAVIKAAVDSYDGYDLVSFINSKLLAN